MKTTEHVIANHFSHSDICLFENMTAGEQRDLAEKYYDALDRISKEEAIIENKYFSIFAQDFFTLGKDLCNKVELYAHMREAIYEYVFPMVQEDVAEHLNALCVHDERMRREIFGDKDD